MDALRGCRIPEKRDTMFGFNPDKIYRIELHYYHLSEKNKFKAAFDVCQGKISTIYVDRPYSEEDVAKEKDQWKIVKKRFREARKAVPDSMQEVFSEFEEVLK